MSFRVCNFFAELASGVTLRVLTSLVQPCKSVSVLLPTLGATSLPGLVVYMNT